MPILYKTYKPILIHSHSLQLGEFSIMTITWKHNACIKQWCTTISDNYLSIISTYTVICNYKISHVVYLDCGTVRKMDVTCVWIFSRSSFCRLNSTNSPSNSTILASDSDSISDILSLICNTITTLNYKINDWINILPNKNTLLRMERIHETRVMQQNVD